MSATEDVWKSPETDSAPEAPAVAAELPSEVSDDPMDVPKAVWADLSAHPAQYLLANFGYMAIAMVFTSVLLAIMFVGIAPGLVMEDETVLAIGGVAGFLVYFLGIMALAFGLVPLWTASMIRALDKQRQGLGTIGFASSFNDMWSHAGAVIGCYALTQCLAFVGILFFYIPGLMAMAIGSFALPIAAIEGVGPMEAWSRAWNHAKNHASWHIAVFVMFFVAMIVAELSIVGLFVIWPVMCGFQLHAYRLAFGEEGSSPVEA